MSKELNTTCAAVCQLCGRPMREHGFGSECRLYVGPADARTSHLPDREEVARVIYETRASDIPPEAALIPWEEAGKVVPIHHEWCRAAADRILSLMERKA